MTTAVASPPSFSNISRLNWNGLNSAGGGFSAMSTDDVSRMFLPQRKPIQRSTSSSSLSSTSSSGSTVTLTQNEASSEPPPAGLKKKARGGFWQVSKPEPTASVTNARANGSLQTAVGNSLVGKNPVQPALPSQSPTTQANGSRMVNGAAGGEGTAILALTSVNGTFEKKQIILPLGPDVLRIGRQTNAKTLPTQVNGYFDSKVLSRQHAEVWADRSGKVFIRDVKSSNGTFVNGHRLSPENRESEPHELRQGDMLELGIDIVSEDQKTVVHHKVSAKVEYAGLPGSSNNVLDLSFGDLDPSHGGAMLPSPVSSPMLHSRSGPGRPAVNGRTSSVSNAAGSQMSSIAQQRMNMWGATPLNVEQLVKTLAVEMRAARQQAEELDQAGTFLQSLLDPSVESTKPPAGSKETGSHRHSNGRVKPPKMEHVARFADPPAPPPQQPLPEKPDAAKASPITTSFTNLLKRGETAKQSNSAGNSPTNSQNSQMLSLIEALTVARKELDSQGAKVKQLEDMLKEERLAREDAEERARRLEQHTAARTVTAVEEELQTPVQTQPSQTIEQQSSQNPGGEPDSRTLHLQQDLDQMLGEMQRLKSDVDKFQQRAETAEVDAAKARQSLVEMIDKIRQENENTEALEIQSLEQSLGQHRSADRIDEAESSLIDLEPSASKAIVKSGQQPNGHALAPRLPEQLERAVATVLRNRSDDPAAIAQSAPYVSMLGVVLIGVGLMAYLNSWQKSER